MSELIETLLLLAIRELEQSTGWRYVKSASVLMRAMEKAGVLTPERTLTIYNEIDPPEDETIDRFYQTLVDLVLETDEAKRKVIGQGNFGIPEYNEPAANPLFNECCLTDLGRKMADGTNFREPALPMRLTARVQLTPEDLLSARRLALGANAKPLILPLLAIFFCAAVFSYHIARFFQGHPPNPGLWGTGIVLCILVWAVFFEAPRKIRKSFARQKSLRKPFEVEFRETRFMAAYADGPGVMAWGDCYKWQYGRDLLVIYQAEELMHLIPRRAFASDDDFKAAIAMLEAKLGKAR